MAGRHRSPRPSPDTECGSCWAVLRTLGRSGVADLVQRASACAVVISERLLAAGFDVLNDVVLNQVLVRYRDGITTERLVAAIQADGRIWCGVTTWRGETALRISVSAWKTSTGDAQRAADVIAECAARLPDGSDDS